MSELSAAILAGGLSTRMGRDKALMEVGGQRLVERLAGRLSSIASDIFVVAKQPLEVGVPEALDEFEEQTPLSGVITALPAARHDVVFVCACDMPFVETGVVQRLAAVAGGGGDSVVPRHAGRLEPLHAVWSVACAPRLEALWSQGERSVRGALERLDARIVDISDGRSFTNVNTALELAAARRAAGGPEAGRT